MQVSDEVVEYIMEVSFLGLNFGSTDKEISYEITKPKRLSGCRGRYQEQYIIKFENKKKMYERSVRCILTYGTETSTAIRQINVAEVNTLRRIMGKTRRGRDNRQKGKRRLG